MKPSAYNYIVPNGDKTIFFNGISESFFEIASGKADVYAEIISNPNRYVSTFGAFLKKMELEGFVLNDEIDEADLLDQKFERILSDDIFHLMILPTYQCNLRCWYCVQDHQDLTMSKETVGKIKQLLGKKIKDERIKNVRISWFGGEPLLGYDIILDITDYTRQLTSKAGKSFICDITTNGALLNKERIEALLDVGVTTYQITIDGDKKTHDTIKVLNNESAFESTMNNINIISEKTKCILRFNYTHETLSPETIIDNIKSGIKPENRKNVAFMIYKVWQEPQNLIDERDVIRIVDLSKEIGIKPQLPTCNLCYSDCTNFNCIFPNGKVEKCDNESPVAAKGDIVNGEIIWQGNIDFHIPAYRNPTFPCKECKYLPICWGPCVAKRNSMLKEYGKGVCQYKDRKDDMRRYIINRCSNVRVNVC